MHEYVYGLLQAFAETIRDEIKKFPEEDQDDVVILFSAHSLPLKVYFNSILIVYLITLIRCMFSGTSWSYNKKKVVSKTLTAL